jgi:hypothetical protein
MMMKRRHWRLGWSPKLPLTWVLLSQFWLFDLQLIQFAHYLTRIRFVRSPSRCSPPPWHQGRQLSLSISSSQSTFNATIHDVSLVPNSIVLLRKLFLPLLKTKLPPSRGAHLVFPVHGLKNIILHAKFSTCHHGNQRNQQTGRPVTSCRRPFQLSLSSTVVGQKVIKHALFLSKIHHHLGGVVISWGREPPSLPWLATCNSFPPIVQYIYAAGVWGWGECCGGRWKSMHFAYFLPITSMNPDLIDLM